MSEFHPRRKFLGAILSLTLSTLIMAYAGGAKAQGGLDDKTRDVLIQKFTGVYLSLAPVDPSKTAVTLRLADLHAERARLLAMKELSGACTTCTAGKEDRLKALQYYREVLPKLNEAAKPKVLTQIGHLSEMVSNEREAVATYEQIIREVKSPEAVAEAHLSLGEMHFKKHRYAEARGEFVKVLEIPKAPSRGLASYRLAWCEFNDGKLESAIQSTVKILRSPDLLTRTLAGDQAQIDKQFQEEVSRDLATFLSRRPLSVNDAELLWELSPEQAKIAHVTYLAGEAERLGQIQSAISIWRFAIERQSKAEMRLEAHVHLAQLEMSQKLQNEAIKDFNTALSLWGELGACPKAPTDGNCKELKSRIRNLVTDWNRVEKKAPSEELLAAYQAYIKVFPDEGDMQIWAGKVAEDRKLYPTAIEHYLTGARLEAKLPGKESADRVEAGLLGAIEAAELAKDQAMMMRAYDQYLEMSQNKKKLLEVRYQKAHIIYEKGDHQAAAEALRAIALSQNLSQDPGEKSLKKQAADLSLDSLVILKDDTRVESWSREYAKLFPQDAKEFASISRKSVLTQAAHAGSASSTSGFSSAWETLNRFDATGATDEERASFFKNKLILAEKMLKFAEARSAAENLLHVPNLSQSDREYALSRKAWLAELVLDFESALVATEKISSGVSADQKWLKLAMYAELAAKDPKPFYSEYLKGSKDDDKNAAIAAAFVREAKDPLKEIEREKAILSKRPEVLAELYLEIFAKSNSPDVAKKALSNLSIAQTTAGKTIARSLFLSDVSKLKSKVEAHRLDGSTQKKMVQTLKARVAMMDEIEKLASRGIASGDWTSQLAVLDLLGKQSDRFYQEVLSLPVPQGLSAEDEQQYLSLLSQQAAPHQVRAQDVQKKVSEFWANEAAMKQIEVSAQTVTGARRTLLTQEIKALTDIAPEKHKGSLASLLSNENGKPREIPTLAELEKARSEVRENPLSRERLENLLALEKKLGRPTMVAYLENRIQTLSAPAGMGAANENGNATEGVTGGKK